MKILIEGAHDYSEGMLQLAEQIIADAKADGDTLLVGDDYDTLDDAVRVRCQTVGVPLDVHGHGGRISMTLSKTGLNIAHQGSRFQRDNILFNLADRVVVIRKRPDPGLSRLADNVNWRTAWLAVNAGKPLEVYEFDDKDQVTKWTKNIPTPSTDSAS